MEHSRAALTVTSARLAAWRTRVAEDEGGAPLGVAAVSVAPNDATSAELELLFVEPGRMGAGIGSALLADVIRLLVERGVARLWILSDPHAEEFYVRRGAVRVGLAPSDTIPGRQVPWLRLDIAHSAPRD